MLFFLIFIFSSNLGTEEYKKETQTLISKPSLKIDELGALNFILSDEDSEIEIKGEDGASKTIILNGKNYNKPAIKLTHSKEKLEIENVTLEGSIEDNAEYNSISDALITFIRKNSDTKITKDTIYENTTIGSPDNYQIVYVNNAKLTLSDNFTGYGILYIEDENYSQDEPIFEMLGNASWYGLIILNQLTRDKTSKVFLKGSAVKMSIGDYVLLGIDMILIGNNLNVKNGNIGVNSPKGSLLIGNNAQVNGSLIANTMVLGNNNQVTKDIYYNRFYHGKNFSLAGEEITPITLPIVQLPDFPSFETGSQNIKKSHNETYYLDAGSYNNIYFGNNCTLYLKGGEYKIRKLLMGNNCNIKYLAPSTIMVAREVVFGNYPTIESGKEGVDADSCIFYIKGHGLLPGVDVFVVGNKAKIHCNIYAPNSTIVLGNNAEYKGALIAQRIITGANPYASLSLKSAFSLPSQDIKIYGAMLFIGNNFSIPTEGANAKIYYSKSALDKINKELSLRPAMPEKWREIE